MKRAIRIHARDFAAVLVLMAIAVAVGGYILSEQRMRFPFFEDAPFELKAEFSTAQAVTPGQGQTVRVSGVRIGDIADVELADGRAVVTMDIDADRKGLVRTDATALLRPKTGLKDMFIELSPGSDEAPVAPEGFTIPVRSTLPDVNPDEVLSALDADTRDYLRLLLGDGAEGLDGNGGDLREILRRFEPTHRDLARVTRLVARREHHLRRLVTSLGSLSSELAEKDDDLAELVSTSSTVMRALAGEREGLGDAVERLPGALRETTSTLAKVERLADVLGPAVTDLRPAARALDDANAAVLPFVTEAAPILRERVRPFVRDARPVVRDLAPPATDLAGAAPDLTRSFTALNAFVNLLGYNGSGREGPEVAGRDEGYLFWAAWLLHNGGSLFSSGDANGPFRPVTIAGTCGTISQTANSLPVLGMIFAPVLSDPTICEEVLG